MEIRVFRVKSMKILISDSQYTIQAYYGIVSEVVCSGKKITVPIEKISNLNAVEIFKKLLVTA